ncbi:MAG: DUF2007 domain-containing protein [Deltaproteobacteria bacterium]|nr:DUF2007 domain-containing protein [Deltaproteobacteria bacterium]
MSWCPRCREEFSSEDSRCPTCDGELLAALPSDEELLTDVEWVPVARDMEPLRAQLLKDLLEQSGIPVVITGERLESFHIYPNLENAVMVPRRWSAEAIAIVASFDADDDDDRIVCSSCGEEVSAEAEACPHCGELFEIDVN